MPRPLAFALAALAAGCAVSTGVSAQTQQSLNAAAAQDAQQADSALNTQYRATMNGLSPASQTLLRGAQRAWITFRDQQCRYESSAVRGGSAYPMVQSGCVARMTTERTAELRRLAQCREGDLACPR
ncbi:hypothetical protein ASG17_15025 [Brevundimonas sp. Leaf363]|uniref:lysozyme inhibitor LprI family protein n=1 Tax=Brevundimonas sp. Leaf363 TaxID=1736353 RepID=UPI000701673E|nr:lysozyme inhibitor LprI family protein [Brevundimonas sp. Leaf363]KQS52914.1 hypothetical protein ASG17_15025 [Brevundimonas sp. Leaf363]